LLKIWLKVLPYKNYKSTVPTLTISSECFPDLACPDDWDVIEGDCIKVFPVQRNWTEARIHCISEGGYLAIIKNAVQNDWISVEINDRLAWFDATDIENEGFWVDRNNQQIPFFNWDRDSFWGRQPNNSTGEDCAIISGLGCIASPLIATISAKFSKIDV